MTMSDFISELYLIYDNLAVGEGKFSATRANQTEHSFNPRERSKAAPFLHILPRPNTFNSRSGFKIDCVGVSLPTWETSQTTT